MKQGRNREMDLINCSSRKVIFRRF